VWETGSDDSRGRRRSVHMNPDIIVVLESSRVAIVRHRRGVGVSVACTDVITGTYFRPEGDGFGTLIGGRRDNGIIVDPDHVRDSADPETLVQVVETASRRAPTLLEAAIAGGTPGTCDMTPDSRPLSGTVPDLDGLALAVGFSGMGVKICPAFGEAVATLIEGRREGAADIRPSRPSRLEEGLPIGPEFPYASEEPALASSSSTGWGEGVRN